MASCSDSEAPPTTLPADYPSAQVPVVGEITNVERIEVGRPMWRISVRARDTVAGSQALLGAGLAPVAPDVPLNAGSVGAVYRGNGYTVAISVNDDDLTYVVSPTPSD